MQLNLLLPSPERALQQTPETRPEVIAERLERLAATASEQAAWELVVALGLLNRTDGSDLNRLKLNPLYEPAVLKLIDKLIVTLPENGTPQTGQPRQIATLAQELAVELAYAWKLAYLEVEQRRSLFGDAKARLSALARLLSALATLAGTSYRTYSAPPPQTWQELHQVYQALRLELLDTGNPGNPELLAAEAAYKRTLLLALADPYRFTRLEMDVTAALLDKFQRLALFSSAGSDKRKKSLFRIDPEADAPCRKADVAAAAPLTLDTYALCKHLRGLIHQLKAGNTFGELGLPPVPARFDGLSLLRRLYQAWRGSSTRGFNRYTDQLGHIEAISGIPALHRLFDSRQKAAADAPVPATEAQEAAAEQACWNILNDSAVGLSISAPAQKAAQLRLGDPVALKMDGQHGAGWMLGVIRWAKMSKGQTVSAGVEKLAPSAASVVLRLLEAGAANAGQPALLIPANPALQLDERLLIPHGLYKQGNCAELLHNGQNRRVALSGLVEQTPFFDLVEIEPA